jgi:hypothetical protein
VSNIKDGVKLLFMATLAWFLCFYKPLTGEAYTSWDTHYTGFLNFLYFSDSLKSGVVPLWNHFIQSGVFFPSLNNIGLFSPFELIFIVLSWLINPAYSFELMIQASVVMGAVGSYLLFRNYTNDRFISLFGAISFATVALIPIVGQISFVFSLGSIPWLALICLRIVRGDLTRFSSLLVIAVLTGFYLASGYPWLNLVNLSIAGIVSAALILHNYFIIESRKNKLALSSLRSCLIFFGVVAFIYACLMLPGYINMHSNYSLFNGDYASPEPRLRSMQWAKFLSYENIYKTIIATIDPRILVNNEAWFKGFFLWSWGSGWVIIILVLSISTRKLLAIQGFLFGLLILALLYSTSGGTVIEDLISKVPLLNANRWGFIGVFYAIICLVFLIIPRLIAIGERVRTSTPNKFSTMIQMLQIVLVGFSALSLLYFFNSSSFQMVFVVVIAFNLVLLSNVRSVSAWNNLLCALMALHVLSVISMPYSIKNIPGNSQLPLDYSRQIIERIQDVLIDENNRKLGEGNDYIYSDESWLLKKIPFSHGYNNLGNPLAWYVKNNPFLSQIIEVTQNVRQEASVERKNFATDNEFAKVFMGDVLKDMSTPTVDANHFQLLLARPDFRWRLDALKIEPNIATMRIISNASAYLVFNNVDYSGWEAYVDGNKVDIVRINRIFQGVYLSEPGVHEVVFKFRPVLTIFLIFLPYLILFLGVFLHFKGMHQRKDGNEN